MASGGNTTLLSSWVAPADGAAGSSVATGGNTLVELVGTGNTFANATVAAGLPV
jgi:hypothetical protein